MLKISSKTKILTVFLLLSTLVLVTISLAFGEKVLNPIQVFNAIFGMESKYNNMLIQTLRLPRIVVAFFLGCSLALAGAILQGIIKNPLASPDILGIVDAGGVGMLVFYTLFINPKNNSLEVSIFYMPLFTFVFAFSSILAIYFFTRKNASSYRLILIGIGLCAIFKAIKNILIINGPVFFIKEAATWVTGTIYGSQGFHAWLITVWFIIFLLLTLLFIKELNLQTLDDSIITTLGSKLTMNRFILLFFAAALTAGAVTVGGGISFVGLIAPHIAKKLVGSRFENLIPVSIFIGGIITIIADMASKWLFYPTELPIGIFTALIGGPYFIYLLIANRKATRRSA